MSDAAGGHQNLLFGQPLLQSLCGQRSPGHHDVSHLLCNNMTRDGHHVTCGDAVGPPAAPLPIHYRTYLTLPYPTLHHRTANPQATNYSWTCLPIPHHLYARLGTGGKRSTCHGGRGFSSVRVLLPSAHSLSTPFPPPN
jgi:hypothetical protein